MSISVLILTCNEEANIQACLDSVCWSDDIVVLDSGSTDQTVEIAKRAGARIEKRAYDNERNQREYSLREIRFKYPWLYNPDADEVTTPELRDEMLGVVSDKGRPEVAYRVRFKVMFMGRWIKHSSLYPTWVMRLFKPERIFLKRRVNLSYHADGPEGRLNGHFIHNAFNKGLVCWKEKHLQYAQGEAEENVNASGQGRVEWSGVFSGDEVTRRSALKSLSARMPFRPQWRFLYMYGFRLGFLDGYPGWVYCRLLAWYENLIHRKVRELRRSQERGRTE